MTQLEKFFKNLKASFFASAAIYLVTGMLLMIFPEQIAKVACYLFGGLFVLAGIYLVIKFFSCRSFLLFLFNYWYYIYYYQHRCNNKYYKGWQSVNWRIYPLTHSVNEYWYIAYAVSRYEIRYYYTILYLWKCDKISQEYLWP